MVIEKINLRALVFILYNPLFGDFVSRNPEFNYTRGTAESRISSSKSTANLL